MSTRFSNPSPKFSRGKIAQAFVALATFLSALWLPWPMTAVLAVAAALWLPLLPLATGILLDALYYAPGTAWFPYGTLLGLLVTVASYLVRTRLAAGIISE